MAAITKGWIELDKFMTCEAVAEMVAYLNRNHIRLVMMGAQIGQPDDLLLPMNYPAEKAHIVARIFIEDEDTAIHFVLKYC